MRRYLWLFLLYTTMAVTAMTGAILLAALVVLIGAHP